jgi:hypothetical protein
MEHRNPISAKTRGRILVVAIITGGLTGPVTLGMATAGVSSGWIAVAAATFASIGTVAAALSRANLTLDKSDEQK